MFSCNTQIYEQIVRFRHVFWIDCVHALPKSEKNQQDGLVILKKLETVESSVRIPWLLVDKNVSGSVFERVFDSIESIIALFNFALTYAYGSDYIKHMHIEIDYYMNDLYTILTEYAQTPIRHMPKKVIEG